MQCSSDRGLVGKKLDKYPGFSPLLPFGLQPVPPIGRNQRQKGLADAHPGMSLLDHRVGTEWEKHSGNVQPHGCPVPVFTHYTRDSWFTQRESPREICHQDHP